MQKIKVDIAPMYPDVEIPEYQTKDSSGCDVKAYLEKSGYPSRETKVYVGETVLISTGLRFSLPDGYEMQIRPRSGLSAKTKLRIANSPGSLDQDYRGELKIIIENIGYNRTEAITIKHGDRIAQLIFAPVVQAEFNIKDELDETKRGSGGFGSTGIH